MTNELLELYLNKVQSDNVNEIGVLPVLGTAITALSLASVSADLYKNHLSNAARKCVNFVGEEKSKCILGYKIGGLKTLIANLNKARTKCPSQRCISNMNKKIAKQRKKLESAQDQLRKVTQQRYEESRPA